MLCDGYSLLHESKAVLIIQQTIRDTSFMCLILVVITFAEPRTSLQCLGHDFTTEVCNIKMR